MKQGLDQRDNHSFEDWLCAAIKFRNPKAAEELERGERLALPSESAKLTADQRNDSYSVQKHLRKHQKWENLIQAIEDDRVELCAYLFKYLSRDLYMLVKALYPRIDSEGDIPKAIRAIKSAYLKDVPETTYEQIMRANKLRGDFANSQTSDMSLERLKTNLEQIYKTFTDWNIPLPPKVDQARDFYGALNPGFFAEVKAYQLAFKYVQPVPTKSGAKTNITFATFQQRNCNFITSTSKSARLTERSAGRAATDDTDDNQEEPRRTRGRGAHGKHKGRRADIDSKEESGGAIKQEEAPDHGPEGRSYPMALETSLPKCKKKLLKTGWVYYDIP
jgi:hypothetical protein